MNTGTFGWQTCFSPDPAASLRFYTGLFGWTTTRLDFGVAGTYDQLDSVSGGFGGIAPMDPSLSLPAHWLVYIFTSDVDRLCARVPEHGGTVEMPPFDIPGIGRSAIVTDPAGGRFVPFEPATGASPAAVTSMPPRPGEPAWHELTTFEPEAAVAFYCSLFGYGHRAVEMGDFTYHLLTLNDQPTAGIMRAPEHARIAHWTIYVEVADATASQQRISDLGGENMTPVLAVPGTGHFALAKDPLGAFFAVLQSDPM